MNRVFQAHQFFSVPDGTQVAPVLNPLDANALGLPRDILQGASIALGRIAGGRASKPHLHPVVTQVTWVLAGALRVRMKGQADPQAYEVDVPAGAGVVTEPMTLLQLVNPDPERAAQVLYIVTPPYVYLPSDDGYDDAIVLDQGWEELMAGSLPSEIIERAEAMRGRREHALARMRAG